MLLLSVVTPPAAGDTQTPPPPPPPTAVARTALPPSSCSAAAEEDPPRPLPRIAAAACSLRRSSRGAATASGVAPIVLLRVTACSSRAATAFAAAAQPPGPAGRACAIEAMPRDRDPCSAARARGPLERRGEQARTFDVERRDAAAAADVLPLLRPEIADELLCARRADMRQRMRALRICCLERWRGRETPRRSPCFRLGLAPCASCDHRASSNNRGCSSKCCV